MTSVVPDCNGLRDAQTRCSVIVVGVDGSDTSMRAAAFAIGLARRQVTRLVFVYVANTTSAAMVPQVLAEIAAASDLVAADLQVSIADALHGWSGEWELRRASGNPYTELTRLAGKLNADQLVVGASEHLGHRFIGSLAVHLVKAKRWPVTVVP